MTMQPLGTPARGGFTGAGVPYMCAARRVVGAGWPTPDSAWCQRPRVTRLYAWRQAFAAHRQKSRIRAGGVGPAISSWLSRMVTAPVDAVICAAVPVPPTQP
jgi:hypothetical protein